MRKFGLIGYPLGHSFSRKYFTEKFKRENINDCSYENYPLSDLGMFSDLIENEPDLCGLNVTIPYKSEIIAHLYETGAEAEEIGAVNVIKFRRKNKHLRLHGYNSDVTGIRDSLAPYVTTSVRNSMVLGTGGSSRAVCYVLKKMGFNVINITRNGREGVVTYSEITPGMINDTSIIVNTTPLGMFPDTATCPELNYNLLSEKHILFDLVYNPELTTFLKKGMERGCTVISGLNMLYSQAEKAWEIWNDDHY